MAATYPSAVKSFTTKAAGDTIQPAHVNDLQAEVTAIETQLLTGGSWTMTIASGGGGAPTYTRNTGYYIKVGGLVFVQGYVTLATIGSLAAGAVTITGLPFTSRNQTDGYAAMHIPYWLNFTSTLVHVGGYLPANSSAITLLKAAAAVTGTSALTVADLSGTAEFIISGCYQI